MPGRLRRLSCDVTVIGGGLAGKAASLHLARAGLKVVCIEPQQAVRPPVGESLDWSAPDLLNGLGLSPDQSDRVPNRNLEAACHSENA